MLGYIYGNYSKYTQYYDDYSKYTQYYDDYSKYTQYYGNYSKYTHNIMMITVNTHGLMVFIENNFVNNWSIKEFSERIIGDLKALRHFGLDAVSEVIIQQK